jgi:hypothetical protein
MGDLFAGLLVGFLAGGLFTSGLIGLLQSWH